VLSTTTELTYELRLQKCSNVLILHSTLVSGWLCYEAYRAYKEAALQEQYLPACETPVSLNNIYGPYILSSSTSKGSRGRAKGRNKGKGKGTKGPSSPPSGPRGRGRGSANTGNSSRAPSLSRDRGARIEEQPCSRSQSTVHLSSPSSSYSHRTLSRDEKYEQFCRAQKAAKRG
jgi:hypothetical protein